MIRDGHADGEFSVEDGAGGHRHAGFLQPQQKFFVDGIQARLGSLRRMKAEADDSQWRGREKFEFVLRSNPLDEVLRLSHILLDEARKFPDSMRFQRQPDLQGAEAAGQFDPAVGKGQSSGDHAAVHPVVTGSMRK